MTKKRSASTSISNSFKLWLVALIFILTGFHLYSINHYPEANIVSDEILLAMVLMLVGYLWIRELRDKENLQTINVALLSTQEQLKEAELSTITTLVIAEETKDPYVRGHSRRVTRCALAIAKELNLRQEQCKVIERAGILHDIGKIGISDTVLHKRSKLTDEEWALIKKHPQRGAEILEPLKFLVRERDIVCHHHERVDGTGYPDGLKEDQISIESRIVAVADTFDAMNSERPYRKPLPENVVLSELTNASGTQLDPRIVSTFLALLKKKPSLWERD